MKEQLERLVGQALCEIEEAASPQALEETRVRYLGKKSELTALLKGMGALSPEERPVMGQLVNDAKSQIEERIDATRARVQAAETELKLSRETIDVTLPGSKRTIGTTHPLTTVLNDLYSIFVGMGFTIAEGPEVEYVYYNFDALNAPKNHPSRDLQDTFYINDEIVLRTQTSPMQVRVMEQNKPPLHIISPGRVYRSDEVDATHSPVFHQLEGLVVDKGITFGDLKGTLETFAKRFYGGDTKVRFRPHHFPFTEPSAEMDAMCFRCHGEGCRLCKGEGYIEILGCGMVHPNVLRNCGIDPEEYSGFAFGMGIERLAMRRYKLDDLRLMFENDTRFLNQF